MAAWRTHLVLGLAVTLWVSHVDSSDSRQCHTAGGCDAARFVTHETLGRKGRLGNQMFQYAAMYALAIQNNAVIKLNASTQLPHFMYRLHVAFDLPILPLTEEDHVVKTFKPKDATSYEPEFWNLFDGVESGGVNLDGYFQSFKYLESPDSQTDMESAIRQQFTFKYSVAEYCDRRVQDLRDECGNCTVVSVHIRRGDNVRPVNGQPIQNSPPPDYFVRTMTWFRDRFPDVHFFIFSDEKRDMNWCKVLLPDDDRFHFSDFMDDVTDLCLMSRCDHHILSPSSFGWWAAWLNPNPDKIVIAPRPWWNLEHLITGKLTEHELLPQSWRIRNMFKEKDCSEEHTHGAHGMDWGIEIDKPGHMDHITSMPITVRYFIWAGKRNSKLYVNDVEVMGLKKDPVVAVHVPSMPNGAHDIRVQRCHDNGTALGIEESVTITILVDVPGNDGPPSPVPAS